MALNLYVFMRRLIQKLCIFSSGILDEGVDGESLALLTERALESLVDKVGPRMKLMRLIKMMKTNSSSHGPAQICLLLHLQLKIVWVLRSRHVLQAVLHPCQYQVKGNLL